MEEFSSEINLSFSFNSLYFFGVQKPNASRYNVEIFFFFQMQLKSFQAHSHLPAANKVELRPSGPILRNNYSNFRPRMEVKIERGRDFLVWSVITSCNMAALWRTSTAPRNGAAARQWLRSQLLHGLLPAQHKVLTGAFKLNI